MGSTIVPQSGLDSGTNPPEVERIIDLIKVLHSGINCPVPGVEDTST